MPWKVRARQKVGIERKHHIGSVKLVNRLGVLPEQGLRSGTRGIAVDRIPLVPLRVREFLQDSLNLPGKCRRNHGFAEEAKAGSTGCRGLREVLIQCVVELAPVAMRAAITR